MEIPIWRPFAFLKIETFIRDGTFLFYHQQVAKMVAYKNKTREDKATSPSGYYRPMYSGKPESRYVLVNRYAPKTDVSRDNSVRQGNIPFEGENLDDRIQPPSNDRLGRHSSDRMTSLNANLDMFARGTYFSQPIWFYRVMEKLSASEKTERKYENPDGQYHASGN